MRLLAPAKINLMLHVTGKRDDGYHLLETVAVFTDVGDYISIESSDGFSLNVTGSEAAMISDLPPENNIITKSAKLLASYAGIKPDVKILLEKNLPAGGGIGGGSADSGAILRGLNNFWQLDLSNDRLAEIALKIGADVPMCLLSKTCIARGIGNEIAELSSPEGIWLLLANPRRHVATRDVFQRTTIRKQREFKLPVSSDAGEWLEFMCLTSNDLTEAAISICPEIYNLLDDIASQHGCHIARMSGSGSTCFGVFTDEQACRLAASSLADIYPAYWRVISAIQ